MVLSAVPDATQRGSLGKDISSLVVRLLREYTGRGPTKARTYIHDDLISVVLCDTLTKGERSLVKDGFGDHVLETRRMYQRTMREDIVAGIEMLTGRRVIAFLSDNHLDPDIALETVVLEPCASSNGNSNGNSNGASLAPQPNSAEVMLDGS